MTNRDRSAEFEQRERGTPYSRWAGTAMLVGLIIIGVWLSHQYEFSVAIAPTHAGPVAEQSGYQPAATLASGQELVLTVVASPTCRWSADPAFAVAIEKMKVQFAEFAASRQMTFRAIMVVVDWTGLRSTDFVEPFGRFDELSIGRSWSNSTLLRYGWDPGLRPSTPTVILHRQHLEVTEENGVRELERQVVLHRSGLSDILLLERVGPETLLGWVEE